MQSQFRFPRSTVLLMLVIFAGTVLTIAKASSIAGATPGSVWPSFVSVVALMLLTMCTAAQLSWAFCTLCGVVAYIAWRTCRVGWISGVERQTVEEGRGLFFMIPVISDPLSGRRRSRLGRIFKWLIMSMALIVLAGAVFQFSMAQLESYRYPPPGKLVDIGGLRLHINCTGAGSPTVIMEAGPNDSSVIWQLVQPEISRFTGLVLTIAPVLDGATRPMRHGAA